jgi:hypothetical protein
MLAKYMTFLFLAPNSPTVVQQLPTPRFLKEIANLLAFGQRECQNQRCTAQT